MVTAQETTTCPVCGHITITYFKAITGTMAATLISLYYITNRKLKEDPDFDGYVHIQNELVRAGKTGGATGGNYCNLKHWRLISPHPKNDILDPKKKTAGFWKITRDGRLFVEKNLWLPKYARTRDDVLMGYEGDKVDIIECLGEHFDYGALMGRSY